MTDPNILLGIAIAVIGFFLRGCISDIKDIKKMAIENEGKLAVLQNDHDNKNQVVVEKHGELKTSIDKLTNKIEVLTEKIK